MSKVAIFASGSGSNAENIVNYFKGRLNSSDFHFFTNNSKAYVNERALKLGVNLTLFSREEFYNSDKIIEVLKEEACELIVLAGFLWLIPENFVEAFKGRIINIHPALLPKFGGKGMYGKRIHEAVVDNKETETGITIHYVDSNYDEGKIIKQVTCRVLPTDTATDVEAKVHELEYEHYPKVIAEMLSQHSSVGSQQ
ncbi:MULTISPECIES: phosphoribosylglycinamide formyltransferase [unclassified Saccharicrinis]|uniref:phosphoribosylglycinamide formyltransferase n=1 Tax=unclassified Saccharicrinis TaxID=2646859 RepID=UPI003D32A234